MAGINPKKDRKVIPRWRSFESTLRHGDLDSCFRPRSRSEVSDEFLVSRISAWQRHRTAGHAADLVGAALTSGHTSHAMDAARFLRERDLSPWTRELAERALGLTPVSEPAQTLNETEMRKRVHALRSWLRAAPRDSISWVDLSLAYAALGQRERAERCMVAALHLAANNRFTLRAASCLWVHLDDPERAHYVVRKSDLTPRDPWLLSAEIAIGDVAGKRSRFIRNARRMLFDRTFPPRHLSELASAVATLEQESGNIKKSRRFFSQSLEKPTENSIAQAAWASTRDSGIHVQRRWLDSGGAFEARSQVFYENSDWPSVVAECRNWQSDQPFSSRPSVTASYVSAVALEDYSSSKSFADRGLKVSPGDFTLLNNLAFACINSGEISEARAALKRIDVRSISRLEQAVFAATSGLLAFRTGDASGGRKLYADALDIAQREKNKSTYALAASFYAIEELSVGGPDCGRSVSEALSALKKMDDSVSEVLIRRLREMAKLERRVFD